MDNTLSLYFQLKEGEKADLEIVSAAAIAWVEALRSVARAVDPDSDIKVELVDADEASLTFNTIIDWFERNVEKRLKRLERGGKKLPRTKKLAIALSIFMVISGVPTWDFYFGDDPFTDEDREMLKEVHEAIVGDPAVETAKRKFFRTLEREPTITGVGIKERPEDIRPMVLVPSDRFPEAGGLWQSEDDGPVIEITR